MICNDYFQVPQEGLTFTNISNYYCKTSFTGYTFFFLRHLQIFYCVNQTSQINVFKSIVVTSHLFLSFVSSSSSKVYTTGKFFDITYLVVSEKESYKPKSLQLGRFLNMYNNGYWQIKKNDWLLLCTGRTRGLLKEFVRPWWNPQVPRVHVVGSSLTLSLT